MTVRTWIAVLAAGALLLLPGLASAAKAPNPDLVYLQKTLKASMVANFKKTSPQIKIGKVTCKLPADGINSLCVVKASAPVGHENIVFKVTATLHDLGGKLTWVTTSHSCTDSVTHKPFKC